MKISKISLFILIFFVFCSCSAFSFSVNSIKNSAKSKIEKAKNFKNSKFSKKDNQTEKPKMVETRQEWETEAQNVSLSDRELKKEKPEIDTKKIYIPETRFLFEKYNFPQGKREINIQDVKKNLSFYPYLVANEDCTYVAYPYYYYSPNTNQISSNFYVEKLDLSKTKKKRILEYNHKQEERFPIIEAGTKEIYQDLFNGLTLVDWNKNQNKLLIKEKVGSTRNGVYKTYLYVHFLETDIENGYTIKLLDFDEAIKYYFIDWENKQIVKYRYDIEPLGFSSENDNMIVAHCFVYDNSGNKIFLGAWGYDLDKKQTILISKTNPIQNISINGIFLKEIYD